MIKSMKGKALDMAALRRGNEKSIAVGNASMNSRGDLLGRGGEVVKTKEEAVADYYRNNPRAVEVAAVSLRSIEEEVMTPQEAWDRMAEEPKEPAPKAKKKKIILSDE